MITLDSSIVSKVADANPVLPFELAPLRLEKRKVTGQMKEHLLVNR